jgi:mono/diheme cytochrome c family protein
VNSYTGPDGALYLVDMYRGLLQHRIYLTTYLRKQTEERGLEKPLDRGRLYRIVPEKKALGPRLSLSKASTGELVQALSHPNGWWRDTAQRLLVERGASSVAPELRALVKSSSNSVARLHALWTLEGIEQTDPETIGIALADKEPKIRAAAIRISEPLLKTNKTETAALRSKVFAMNGDPAAEVQTQLALSLTQLAPEPTARQIVSNLLQKTFFALTRDSAKFALVAFEPPKTMAAIPKPVLSPVDQKKFDAGKMVYEATCLACHQPHGFGQEGLAPPLVGSEWIAATPERLIRIVLNGLRGPIHVKKQTFELDMPSLGVLEDEQIANVLTYVRKEWGHSFSSVDPGSVKQIRDATAQREDAWTEEELKKIR